MGHVAGGDTLALACLYDRYAAFVMGFVLKTLPDRGSAEEVVFETFWRVWSYRDSFQFHSVKFVDWLSVTAYGLTMSIRHRQLL